mmetsp:Transcript_344/g.469  ORF Transcript_344/g.469 Transcript_344/m.469 type:complete len:236 (+) Transcript_344:94-801(+)
MDSAGTHATIALHVAKLTGMEVMSTSFLAHETVRDVKKALNVVTNAQIADLKLVWEAEELEDFKALKDYNLPDIANLTLLIMNPLARWLRLLQDSSGNDFRSQLKRRDAVRKINEIISQNGVEENAESIDCLLDGFRLFRECQKQRPYGCSESITIYIEAIKAAAKGSGHAEAINFFINDCPNSSEKTIESLCEVIGTNSPSPAAIEFLQLQSTRGSFRARRFLREVMQRTKSAA